MAVRETQKGYAPVEVHTLFLREQPPLRQAGRGRDRGRDIRRRVSSRSRRSAPACALRSAQYCPETAYARSAKVCRPYPTPAMGPTAALRSGAALLWLSSPFDMVRPPLPFFFDLTLPPMFRPRNRPPREAVGTLPGPLPPPSPGIAEEKFVWYTKFSYFPCHCDKKILLFFPL